MHNIKLRGTDNFNLGDDLLYLSAIEILKRTNLLFQVNIDSKRIRTIVNSFFKEDNIHVNNRNDFSLSLNVGGTLFSSKYRVRTKIGHLLGIKRIPFDMSSDIYISLGVDKNYFLKKISKISYNYAKCIIVRDVESHIIISKSIKCHNSHMLPDTVFGLKNRLVEFQSGSEYKDYNVFILRDWKFNKHTMNKQVKWFLANKSKNDIVVFFCKNDLLNITFNNSIVTYTGTYDSMKVIIGIIKAAKKVYTSRYHGIVLAIALEKDYELFSIDEKLSRLDQYYNSNSEDHEIYIDLNDGEGIANSYAKIIQEYI